jgi:hypothetical protein
VRVRTSYRVSRRRPCELVLQWRPRLYHHSLRSRRDDIRRRLRKLAADLPRYGYLRLHTRLLRKRHVENAFTESFNGRLGEERLNLNWLETLEQAKAEIETWASTTSNLGRTDLSAR